MGRDGKKVNTGNLRQFRKNSQARHFVEQDSMTPATESDVKRRIDDKPRLAPVRTRPGCTATEQQQTRGISKAYHNDETSESPMHACSPDHTRALLGATGLMNSPLPALCSPGDMLDNRISLFHSFSPRRLQSPLRTLPSLSNTAWAHLLQSPGAEIDLNLDTPKAASDNRIFTPTPQKPLARYDSATFEKTLRDVFECSIHAQQVAESGVPQQPIGSFFETTTDGDAEQDNDLARSVLISPLGKDGSFNRYKQPSSAFKQYQPKPSSRRTLDFNKADANALPFTEDHNSPSIKNTLYLLGSNLPADEVYNNTYEQETQHRSGSNRTEVQASQTQYSSGSLVDRVQQAQAQTFYGMQPVQLELNDQVSKCVSAHAAGQSKQPSSSVVVSKMPWQGSVDTSAPAHSSKQLSAVTDDEQQNFESGDSMPLGTLTSVRPKQDPDEQPTGSTGPRPSYSSGTAEDAQEPTRRGKEGNNGPKTCHCKKSQCLKLYCDCFAAGMYCTNCNCVGCYNRPEHQVKVMEKRDNIVQRDPEAFKRKIMEAGQKTGRHKKGCNCKRSHCLKKYCECFQAGVKCGECCKCLDCQNLDETLVIVHEDGTRTPRNEVRIAWHVPPGMKMLDPAGESLDPTLVQQKFVKDEAGLPLPTSARSGKKSGRGHAVGVLLTSPAGLAGSLQATPDLGDNAGTSQPFTPRVPVPICTSSSPFPLSTSSTSTALRAAAAHRSAVPTSLGLPTPVSASGCIGQVPSWRADRLQSSAFSALASCSMPKDEQPLVDASIMHRAASAIFPLSSAHGSATAMHRAHSNPLPAVPGSAGRSVRRNLLASIPGQSNQGHALPAPERELSLALPAADNAGIQDDGSCKSPLGYWISVDDGKGGTTQVYVAGPREGSQSGGPRVAASGDCHGDGKQGSEQYAVDLWQPGMINQSSPRSMPKAVPQQPQPNDMAADRDHPHLMHMQNVEQHLQYNSNNRRSGHDHDGHHEISVAHHGACHVPDSPGLGDIDGGQLRPLRPHGDDEDDNVSDLSLGSLSMDCNMDISSRAQRFLERGPSDIVAVFAACFASPSQAVNSSMREQLARTSSITKPLTPTKRKNGVENSAPHAQERLMHGTPPRSHHLMSPLRRARHPPAHAFSHFRQTEHRQVLADHNNTSAPYHVQSYVCAVNELRTACVPPPPPPQHCPTQLSHHTSAINGCVAGYTVSSTDALKQAAKQYMMQRLAASNDSSDSKVSFNKGDTTASRLTCSTYAVPHSSQPQTQGVHQPPTPSPMGQSSLPLSQALSMPAAPAPQTPNCPASAVMPQSLPDNHASGAMSLNSGKDSGAEGAVDVTAWPSLSPIKTAVMVARSGSGECPTSSASSPKQPGSGESIANMGCSDRMQRIGVGVSTFSPNNDKRQRHQ